MTQPQPSRATAPSPISPTNLRQSDRSARPRRMASLLSAGVASGCWRFSTNQRSPIFLKNTCRSLTSRGLTAAVSPASVIAPSRRNRRRSFRWSGSSVSLSCTSRDDLPERPPRASCRTSSANAVGSAGTRSSRGDATGSCCCASRSRPQVAARPPVRAAGARSVDPRRRRTSGRSGGRRGSRTARLDRLGRPTRAAFLGVVLRVQARGSPGRRTAAVGSARRLGRRRQRPPPPSRTATARVFRMVSSGCGSTGVREFDRARLVQSGPA